MLVADALAAGIVLREVFLEEGRAGDSEHSVARRAEVGGANIQLVPDGTLERIGASKTPPPLLATAEIPKRSSGEPGAVGGLGAADRARASVGVGPGAESGVHNGMYNIVAVDMADPSNAGALLRCAEGAGALEVVFAGHCADPWGPKAVRASAGSVFRMVPSRMEDTVAYLEQSAQLASARQISARQIIGTSSFRGVPYDSFEFKESCVILFGNEAHGLPAFVDDYVTDWIHVPLAGETESLNVAMSAAVICFEAKRQLLGSVDSRNKSEVG